MTHLDTVLNRLRTEAQLAKNGDKPILERSLTLAIAEIEQLRDMLRQSTEYIETLVRPTGNESSMHFWARGVELSTKARGIIQQIGGEVGMNDQACEITANPRICTCHPDDSPPNPCPRKYALTHCRAADLGKRLRHAITTAMNDDFSKVGTEKRKRHSDRLDTMSAAAAFLEDRW